jgi:carbamoyl-phosphate synthase large subunit
MNFLFCSVGRRAELIKVFRKSLDGDDLIIATDNSALAPALYLADKQYLVPRVDDSTYVDILLNICKEEKIRAITTFIDSEIEILGKNRSLFSNIGVELLLPYEETARLCFDKFEMYQYLKECTILTPLTFGNICDFKNAFKLGEISFPVFIKPRTGSGSVGAEKIHSLEELEQKCNQNPTLIIQEFMSGLDLDVDVYIDIHSHQAVSAFCKKKLETKIGGASKTISFKDSTLFTFIAKIVDCFKFSGPIDMDFFYRDGKYYLSEINPRFGGAYLHAYGAGVDFIKLIKNNLNGVTNESAFGDYEDGVVMMMYDSVVIEHVSRMDNLKAVGRGAVKINDCINRIGALH